MTTVTITLDDKTAQAVLARAGQLPGGKAMRAVSLAMKNEVYRAFKSQRAPSGAAWPGLSPLTIANRKRRGNHSEQPLIDTGAMYAGVEAANTDSTASVTMGGNVPDARAVWNQFGTPRAPARPVFPMTESAANPTQAWLEVVIAPVRESMKEAFA